MGVIAEPEVTTYTVHKDDALLILAAHAGEKESPLPCVDGRAPSASLDGRKARGSPTHPPARRLSSAEARRGLGSSPQLAPETRTLPRSTVRRTLRFGVGERVECKTGKKEWSAGEVVALMFHDKESMPVGQIVPYQILSLIHI